MSGVYECEDGQVLVSLDDDGCIASQVAGVKVMFGCQDCQESFSNARDVVTHVKEGKCKAQQQAAAQAAPAVPKRPRGRPRKDASAAQADAANKQKDDLEEWAPNSKVALTTLTPVRRATRVSTGAMPRKSIVDIIENVSARKDQLAATPSKAEGEDDTPGISKHKKSRRPRQESSEAKRQKLDPSLTSETNLTSETSSIAVSVADSNPPNVTEEGHGSQQVESEICAVVESESISESDTHIQPSSNQAPDPPHEASNDIVATSTSESQVPDAAAKSSTVQRTLIEHAYQDVHTIQPSTVIVIKPAPVTVLQNMPGNYEEPDEGEEIVEEGVDVSGDVASILREATELVNSPHMTDVQVEVAAEQPASSVSTVENTAEITQTLVTQTSQPVPSTLATKTPKVDTITIQEVSVISQSSATVMSQDLIRSDGQQVVIVDRAGSDQTGDIDATELDMNNVHLIVREMQEEESGLNKQMAAGGRSDRDSPVRIFTGKRGRPRLSYPNAPRKRTERHYKCSLCRQRFFYTQDELSLHEACHVDKEKPDAPEQYRCIVCAYTSSVWNRLLDHVVTHEEIRVKYKYSNFLKNIIGNFTCTICNKVFDRKNNMKSHVMKVHHKVERTCMHCRKNLGPVDDKTYKRHLEKCQGNWLTCTECSYKTRVSANLRKHMKVHLGKGFTCEVCNAVFPTRQRYEVHRAIHNTVRPKYICEHCSAEFISADAVHKHVVRVHAEVKELFQCNECKFLAKLESDLKKHVNIVHNKKHKCDHCPYQTNSLAAIQQHAEYHRPGRQFPCPYENCYYRGSTGRHLTNHVNQVHRTSCKHQCPICHKFYKKKTHLARHLVTHTGDKPYSCLECGEQFVTHSTYYRHRNKTGHDAKREGIVSVPQNITIQYVSHEGDLQLDGGEEVSAEDFSAVEGVEAQETTELPERPRYVMFDDGTGEKVTYVVEVEGNDASSNFGDEALAQLLQSQFQYSGKQVSLLKQELPVESQQIESTTSQSEDMIQVATDTELTEISEGVHEETVTIATDEVHVQYDQNPGNLVEEEMSYEEMPGSVDEMGVENTDAVQLVMNDGSAIKLESNMQEETVSYAEQPVLQTDNGEFIHLQRVDGNTGVQLHQMEYQYPQAAVGEQVHIEGVEGAETIQYQEVQPDGTVQLQDVQFADMSQQMEVTPSGDHQYQHQYETIVEIAAPGSDDTEGSERHQYAIVMMPEHEPEAALSMLQLHSGVQ